VPLRTNELAAVEQWTKLLRERYDPTIEVAARRLVSAAGMRADRQDILIDSITVWENLVGARPETTFRLTAALAKLLDDDGKTRRVFQKSLSNLYSLRSDVVHGRKVGHKTIGPAKEKCDTQLAASLALEIAASAFAAVVRRPELLAMDSTGRSDELLLG
jgi:hypothetical protein